MSIYKVLIADDEPSVIESLKESVNWQELGLTVAAWASSGKEALEIIRREQIDIAILDIRMPGLSGLELCEALHRERQDIQLIIISGYAEFSYAERAIRYGVLGYCLKPLEYDQVTRFLCKAVNNLQRTELTVSNVDFLDALESGQQEVIGRVIKRMGFSQDIFYTAASIGEEAIPLACEEGTAIICGRGQYRYLLRKPLDESILQLFTEKDFCLGVGYLSEAVDSSALAAAFDECEVRAYQYFINPGEKLGKPVDDAYCNELLRKLKEHVDNKRWETVSDMLSSIRKTGKGCFNVRSAMRLSNILYTGSLFHGEETDYYIYSIKQLILEYGSFDEMLKRLKDSVDLARTERWEQEDYSNAVFMKLMGYINDNYKNEISLTSAGEALHLNPNYVSQLFKKEAGITFVHYITQLRMNEAIRLLTTTGMSVVEIAAETGYNDYFYFLKLFKKHTGKAPGQYREEN